MSRKNLLIKDISRQIGVTARTVGRKLARKYPLTIREAFQIQGTFFPEKTVDWLFAEDRAKKG